MFSDIANKDLLRLYISDEEIYEFVLGEEVYDGLKLCSTLPFRDDPNPSMAFTYTSTNHLMWKDFGFSEQEKFDAVGLATYMKYGEKAIKDHEKYRAKTCNLLWEKLVLNREEDFQPLVRDKKAIKRFKGNCYMDFLYGEWDKNTLKYWKQYGITRGTLEKYNVKPLKELFVYDKPMWSYSNDEPMYLYTFSEEQSKYKVYRPLSDSEDKFRSQNISHVIEGFGKLPTKMDTVFITSSLKDTMTLYEAGFNACNPTSETNVPIVKFLIQKNLKNRANKIVILFDNDEQGIISAKKILDDTSKVNVVAICMPISLKDKGIKDPSDYSKKYGVNKLKKLVTKLLENRKQKVEQNE